MERQLEGRDSGAACRRGRASFDAPGAEAVLRGTCRVIRRVFPSAQGSDAATFIGVKCEGESEPDIVGAERDAEGQRK